MDGFHVEGMTENEFDAVLVTEIRDPVPHENAFDADDEIVHIGPNDFEEPIGASEQVFVDKDIPFAIDDTDVDVPCVQVDTAIV